MKRIESTTRDTEMNCTREWDLHTCVKVGVFRVTLSTPVLVRRSRRYNWLPQLHRMSNGDLLATIGAHADTHVTAQVKLATRSQDGGLTWDEPRLVLDGGSDSLTLPTGELLLLPRILRRREAGMGAPCNRFALDGVLHHEFDGVTVYGVPGDYGLICFDGQPLVLDGGGYLTTVYVQQEGTARSSLALVRSDNGYHWTYVATLVRPDSPLPGTEGANEAMLCRLPDRRLMCVFRVQSDEHGMLPLCQSWSEDGGSTWSAPVSMQGPASVEPSVVVMPSGLVALSTGRPGVNLWVNADGKGAEWTAIDIADHHTACHPGDPILKRSLVDDKWWTINTTGYTEIVSLGGPYLLMIYDRLAKGWDVIRDDENESNSVWVLRARIEG